MGKPTMLLEVQDLNTYYGTSHVLQGISLNVDQGELVALLGRNGMGKSTTLKSIMGVVKPKSGSVIFKGKKLSGIPLSKQPGSVSAMFQRKDASFLPFPCGKTCLWGSREGKLKTPMILTPGLWKEFFSTFPCWKKGFSRKECTCQEGNSRC